jgi:hypothetical protein
VRQQVWRAGDTFAFAAFDGLSEVLCVPVDNDCGEQIESRDAEVLAFGGAIADFALSTDAQRVLEGMMRLALIQADLGAALHVGIERPFEDEQRPFNPSDFLEGFGEGVLAGICCELTQQLTGWHDARDHGCRAA